MLLSFLLAVAAGFAVPYAEPPLRRAFAAALKSDVPIGKTEGQVVTLLLLLAVSALLTAAAGVNTVSLATVIGGALGYFGRPLYAFLRDPDGTDVPDAERWDGQVRSGGSPREEAAAETASDAEILDAVGDAMRDTPKETPPQNDRKEPSS